MPEISEDMDRDELINKYEETNPPTDTWVNFGDANPAIHGGRWITYNPEYQKWELYVTFQSGAILPDVNNDNPGDQFVQYAEIWFSDICDEEGTPTDMLKNEINALHNANESLVGNIVDNRLTWLIAGMQRPLYQLRNPRMQRDSYAAVLDSLGIEPRDN
jgi:hypothetical protein